MFYGSLRKASNNSEDNPLHRGMWSMVLIANTSPVLTWAREPHWSNHSTKSLKWQGRVCCSVLQWSALPMVPLKEKKNLPKRQSQIGVILYDSEADPILVSEFPPSHSRRPLLTSSMAIPRFQTGFASGFQCNFSGAPTLERAVIDTLHPSATDGISF